MENRIYYAVSIKHTSPGWKFGMPLYLWGSRTKDEDKRSFSGYTQKPDEAELYSVDDFLTQCGHVSWILDYPVRLEIGFCKKYKAYDTVLVDKYSVENYYELSELEVKDGK